MKDWTPQQWVGVILALTVLLTFLLRLIYSFVHPDDKASPEVGLVWLDILKYIVGGLIVYMGQGKKGHE